MFLVLSGVLGPMLLYNLLVKAYFRQCTYIGYWREKWFPKHEQSFRLQNFYNFFVEQVEA
jgi:hypothetical protein